MSATRQPMHDDRYVAPLESSRQGAHRAQANPALAVVPYLTIAVVVVLAGVLAVKLFLGNTGSTNDSTTLPADSTASASSSSSAQASSSASTTAAGTTAQTTVKPNFTIVVTVLNSTSTKGLAGKAAAFLVTKGWKKAAPAFTAATPQNTTVYYASASQKVTADAIAAAFGLSSVKRDATVAGAGITVVVGTDYTG